MEIKILGTGCPKCQKLEQTTRDVIRELGIDADVVKVDDIMEIMNYGIAATPAMIVDGKVVVRGRTATADEIRKILTGS